MGRLVNLPNGAIVPADEPAVAAARAEHLNAKAKAVASVPSFNAAPSAAGGYKYNGPQNTNTRLVNLPNGAVVPADEPAVAAARAEHLNAKAKAAASASPLNANPAAAGGYNYNEAQNTNTRLVNHPNGAVVPADEPAVAAARAAHLNAKSQSSTSGPGAALVGYPNGAVVPKDDPAVAAARAVLLGTNSATGSSYPAAQALSSLGNSYGNGPISSAGGYGTNSGLVSYPNGAVVPAQY